MRTNMERPNGQSGLGSSERHALVANPHHASGFPSPSGESDPLPVWVLPEVELNHLLDLTDDTGLLQHAVFDIPNYQEGYTTDDNARAAMLALLLEPYRNEDIQSVRAFLRNTPRYVAVLFFAFNRSNGRFRNFLSYDRRWLEEAGSEDSHGRAVRTLGMMAAQAASQSQREAAQWLFKEALPTVIRFTSPRAWASAILGIIEFSARSALTRSPFEQYVRGTGEMLAGRLLELYRNNATNDWPWFEEILTYANAELPQALVTAGRWMEDVEMLDIGLQSLDWIVRQQHSGSGCFSPIGTDGFYARNGKRSHWDQQPIEAYSTIVAAIAAFHATGDTRWRNEAEIAFHWFLGANDLGLQVCDPQTGACFDGLHPDRVNRNKGAESTLCYALSLVAMRGANES
ncbi:MAG: hypothetical protein Q8922_01360 [Bacteroidota bacterium]|nr:hypothetical protein [Bacteroidota bacterium]MDP4232125.1 hypothetical protein [Bacteroidota bacterium]MDP4241167.1 hypothetical protein [Bacteroidota bacterium]MDP4286559.1 hypothetical protein [Bacteroidota bacterium]